MASTLVSNESITDGGARRPRHVTSVRQAVREDVSRVRDRATQRTSEAMDAMRDAPLKTVLYAAGVGVIIGLLLRR